MSNKISRRNMLKFISAGAGTAFMAGSPFASMLPRVMGQDRPLTPTFYDWIISLHPSIPDLDAQFDNLDRQIAPVSGFGIERFVAEARDGMSTWDVYVGMTPFVEMTQLIEADVIEPWDDYIPQEILDDLVPSIREECSVDGKLYSWPFLLDIIGMAWNGNVTEAAGLMDIPTTWDQYLEGAAAIVDSGAAPFGATFDAHGWRSLVPFTYSLSTDVYREDGTWDFTNEAVAEALMLMKNIMEYSHPDILLEGASDGGVNGTPDEVNFATGRVGYYTKYFNAPTRFASQGGFIDKLGMAGLPAFDGGEGFTAFWTTGSCLFKHGQNKEAAVEYMRELTYSQQIWRDSVAGDPDNPEDNPMLAQLPPYLSVYADWDENTPEWMQDYVGLMRDQLENRSKAINNHAFGLSQFQIAKEHLDKYLDGSEADIMVALQAAQDAVDAAIAEA